MSFACFLVKSRSHFSKANTADDTATAVVVLSWFFDDRTLVFVEEALEVTDTNFTLISRRLGKVILHFVVLANILAESRFFFGVIKLSDQLRRVDLIDWALFLFIEHLDRLVYFGTLKATKCFYSDDIRLNLSNRCLAEQSTVEHTAVRQRVTRVFFATQLQQVCFHLLFFLLTQTRGAIRTKAFLIQLTVTDLHGKVGMDALRLYRVGS